MSDQIRQNKLQTEELSKVKSFKGQKRAKYFEKEVD